MSGNISDVGKMHPLRFSDIPGAGERGFGCWRKVAELVHGPEAGEVQRGFFAAIVFDPAYECEDVVVTVVPCWDNKVGDLNPDPEFFHSDKAVQHGLECGA